MFPRLDFFLPYSTTSRQTEDQDSAGDALSHGTPDPDVAETESDVSGSAHDQNGDLEDLQQDDHLVDSTLSLTRFCGQKHFMNQIRSFEKIYVVDDSRIGLFINLLLRHLQYISGCPTKRLQALLCFGVWFIFLLKDVLL